MVTEISNELIEIKITASKKKSNLHNTRLIPLSKLRYAYALLLVRICDWNKRR